MDLCYWFKFCVCFGAATMLSTMLIMLPLEYFELLTPVMRHIFFIPTYLFGIGALFCLFLIVILGLFDMAKDDSPGAPW